MALTDRPWMPDECERYVRQIVNDTAAMDTPALAAHLEALAQRNRRIHEHECFNLNPATNVINPRAEALMAQGLGSRPSLGYPGGKYEMGLEAIEQIEVVAAALGAEVFDARYAEVRVASGAMANLYAFMAVCQPGDAIIVPPATIGGHVTHREGGCAGLYGLQVYPAPVDADGYSIDIQALRTLADEVRPRLISIGGSLNLFPHPVGPIREVADEIGAKVLFDAAHLCGLIAGKAWANPLHEGAHLMTMSTYKSLAGPAGGLIVTSDAELAERLDAIAFPGMTANFDVAKTAALAMTLLDWREHGTAYAAAMVRLAGVLARALDNRGVPVYAKARGYTASHQFAVEAAAYGGGQSAARRLRRANLLACGIGLPLPSVEGDLNGLRLGTPELVRWGVSEDHAPYLAELIARALTAEYPERLAPEVTDFRKQFEQLHFIGGLN